MNASALRGVVLLIALACGLTACLSSDAPDLSAADLTEPSSFAGNYFATDFPEEKSDKPAIDGTVEAIGERGFRLTFAEGDHKDEPVLVRLLALNDGNLLGVMTDPDPAKGAMYAIVTHAANGGWVFRVVDLAPGGPSPLQREAMRRHGATAVDYTSGTYEETHMTGRLTAANLRALFSDRDFTGALDNRNGFRLSPKVAATSGIAVD